MGNDISVLMSVYFKEKHFNLISALESIIKQTLPPKEIIVVKDGPLGPDLESVINDYKFQYPDLFIIVALEYNKGLGEALRTGVTHCNCDFIARMDSDDIARPNRFQVQMDFFLSNPDIDVVGSNIEEFNLIPGDLKRFKLNPETHVELIQKIGLKSPFNHPTIMMKKNSLLKAGNYNGDLLLFEDYALFLRMFKVGLKFYNIQEVLLDFRVGTGIETIKRRSGVHYLKKEINFVNYAKSIGVFSRVDVIKYQVLKFPFRLLPPSLVLILYNKVLRHK